MGNYKLNLTGPQVQQALDDAESALQSAYQEIYATVFAREGKLYFENTDVYAKCVAAWKAHKIPVLRINYFGIYSCFVLTAHISGDYYTFIGQCINSEYSPILFAKITNSGENSFISTSSTPALDKAQRILISNGYESPTLVIVVLEVFEDGNDNPVNIADAIAMGGKRDREGAIVLLSLNSVTNGDYIIANEISSEGCIIETTSAGLGIVEDVNDEGGNTIIGTVTISAEEANALYGEKILDWE